MQSTVSDLRKHIQLLCSDGRRPGSTGYKRTQDYICDYINSTGNTVNTQEFYALPFGRCKNIYTEVGPTESAIPRIVIGAHYDTLGRSGPGADDNASAVAVVLELMAHASNKLPITFVFFDYEEMFGFGALKGSKAFVADYKKPIRKAIILDLVGGSLMPGFDNVYFQFGQALPPLTFDRLDFYHLPILFVEPVGSCLPRSDYGRFRSKGVPFTFISSGTPWYYHTLDDVPDNLLFEKMARLVGCLIQSLSHADIITAPNLLPEPGWDRFSELTEKISAVPAFDNAFFHKLSALEDGPSRLNMMRMYFKVLPVLKKLGADLWQ